jgi:hypothetical protein
VRLRGDLLLSPRWFGAITQAQHVPDIWGRECDAERRHGDYGAFGGRAHVLTGGAWPEEYARPGRVRARPRARES